MLDQVTPGAMTAPLDLQRAKEQFGGATRGGVGVSSPPPLVGLSRVPAQLGHFGEGTPGPTRQLAVTELFRDPDRVSQVLLSLIEAAEVSLDDAARGPRVGQLPAGA